MKTVVTVLKEDLHEFPDLLKPLTNLSEKVEDESGTFRFHPKTGAVMNLICVLLDKEVYYRLSFEDISSERYEGRVKREE